MLLTCGPRSWARCTAVWGRLSLKPPPCQNSKPHYGLWQATDSRLHSRAWAPLLAMTWIAEF